MMNKIYTLEQEILEHKKSIAYLKNLNKNDQEDIKNLYKKIEVLVDNEAFNGGRWIHYSDTSFLKDGKKYYVLVDGKIKRYKWDLDGWWKKMDEMGCPDMYLVIHKPDLEGRVKGMTGDNYQKYLMEKLKNR